MNSILYPIMNRFRKVTILGLALLLVVTFFSFFTANVSAVDSTKWDPGLIISDSLFFNKDSMSKSEIQSFLAKKNPTCDTWGTKPATEFGRSDISHAEYAKQAGLPKPPYICLKNYYQVPRTDRVIDRYNSTANKPEGSISAAGIIKRAANKYNISPKVLLVMLQKESPGPLVTDTWPLKRQYKNAMGYACPDTAPCDAQYAGFYNQMMNAARQFDLYKKYANSYRHTTNQTNSIYFHPDLTRCGKSNVYIKSQATAALYNYTPYQPNSASLSNYPGTGNSCSSYGNRNFWFMYSNWFGTTVKTEKSVAIKAINSRYWSLGGADGVLGKVIGSVKTDSPAGIYWKTFENGNIYWNRDTAKAWESRGEIFKYWGRLGYQNSKIGLPTGPERRIKSGGGGFWQSYENGVITGKADTGYWVSKGSIREYYATIGYEGGSMGYPTGPERMINNELVQEYENGSIRINSRGDALAEYRS